MRLIDAEPLVKLLHSRCTQLSNDYGSLAGAVSGCLRLLQSQPTISALINEPLTQEELRGQLVIAQNKTRDTGRFKLWKGRVKKREKDADK